MSSTSLKVESVIKVMHSLSVVSVSTIAPLCYCTFIFSFFFLLPFPFFYRKGVGSNSLQCNSCQKWVHKKCSGIEGSMSKAAKSFICSGCLNPVTSAGRSSVDIGASAKLELVDKFCYLHDMLSVDGDADAAVEARIRIGWNKFRQLVSLLTNKDLSLIMRGRLYSSCVRSTCCIEVRPGL